MECRYAQPTTPACAGPALSRSLIALDQNSQSLPGRAEPLELLVGGVVPGIERQPRKSWSRAQNGCSPCCTAGGMRRSGPAPPSRGLRLPSKPPRRFWLARWLEARGVEAHVIHARVSRYRGSIAERNRPARHRVAQAGFLGWLRGERAIAAWRVCQPLPKRTPSGPTASATAW